MQLSHQTTQAFWDEVEKLGAESSTRKLLEEMGPPNEWSGSVAAVLGEERRKALSALWTQLSAEEKAKVQAKFSANFMKTAATRQLKELRSLFGSGQTAAGNALASKLHSAGVLKVTGPGSQLARLGGGAEGVAHTVIGNASAPGREVVRKTFDRGGALFSPQLLEEKLRAGKQLRGDSRFAELLSNRLGKGQSGGRYLTYEKAVSVPMAYPSPWVQGYAHPSVGTAINRDGAAPIHGLGQATHALRGRGKGGGGDRILGDVAGNPGNYVRGKADTPIILDYMPTTATKQREVYEGSLPARQNLLAAQGYKSVPGEVSPRGPGYVTHMDEETTRTGAPRQGAGVVRYRQLQTRAENFNHMFGTQAAPSDFDIVGNLRRADGVRAVQGLGPGSRQAPQAPGGARSLTNRYLDMRAKEGP